MDPQTIDLDHGRPLLDPLEKHALGLLNSLQLRVRLEAQPLAERFGEIANLATERERLTKELAKCSEL